jgi:hypothetical protein
MELERIEMVAGQVPLPGMPEDGVHVPAAAPGSSGDLSADRRRAVRQRKLVDQGWHPLTRTPARPELGSCGSCVHRVFAGRGAKRYPKCDVGPSTSGAATDVRRWWPACDRWQGKP